MGEQMMIAAMVIVSLTCFFAGYAIGTEVGRLSLYRKLMNTPRQSLRDLW